MALYLAGRSADWETLLQRLARLDVTMTAVAIVLAVLVIYLKAARWSTLLRSTVSTTNPTVSVSRQLSGIALVPIVLVGQLVNNGLPLRIGELVRIEALASRAVSRLYGASTVVVEKLCDGVALLVFTAILSLVVPLPPWLNRYGILLGVIGAIVLVAGGLTLRPILRYVGWRSDRLGRVVSAVASSLVALRAPAVACQVGGWTLLSWIVGLLVNDAALRASGATPTAGLILLVTVAGYAGGLLPAPPGRLGVFQYVCVLAAEAFGVDPTTALVFAAVEYLAVVVVPSALGGLCLVGGLVDQAGALAAGRPRR